MYYKTIFIICNRSVLINTHLRFLFVFFYEASLGWPWTTLVLLLQPPKIKDYRHELSFPAKYLFSMNMLLYRYLQLGELSLGLCVNFVYKIKVSVLYVLELWQFHCLTVVLYMFWKICYEIWTEGQAYQWVNVLYHKIRKKCWLRAVLWFKFDSFI